MNNVNSWDLPFKEWSRASLIRSLSNANLVPSRAATELEAYHREGKRYL